jgi:DNA-binding transcriptional LysR family regulator
MNAKQESGELDWDDLRLLLAVARTGSLLAAGRTLGAATSTLSRRLTRLEQRAGSALLERRRDGVRLTDAGRRLAETAHDIELRVGARLRELPADARALRGTVRVTAGDGFGDVLVGAIASFAVRHPAVTFEVAIESRAADLSRGEADLALRTVHRREPSLVYRTVGMLPYGLFAAHAYVERHGTPRAAADLRRHRFVGFAPPLDRQPVVGWMRAHGAERFVVRVTTFGALLAAVRAGAGIGALPEALAGGLEPVLPRTRPEPLVVYLARHADTRRLPHVRAFADHLVRTFQTLGGEPAR